MSAMRHSLENCHVKILVFESESVALIESGNKNLDPYPKKNFRIHNKYAVNKLASTKNYSTV
jgi:hypothetical protein